MVGAFPLCLWFPYMSELWNHVNDVLQCILSPIYGHIFFASAKNQESCEEMNSTYMLWPFLPSSINQLESHLWAVEAQLLGGEGIGSCSTSISHDHTKLYLNGQNGWMMHGPSNSLIQIKHTSLNSLGWDEKDSFVSTHLLPNYSASALQVRILKFHEGSNHFHDHTTMWSLKYVVNHEKSA